jgi:hypothetical protein
MTPDYRTRLPPTRRIAPHTSPPFREGHGRGWEIRVEEHVATRAIFQLLT